MSTDEWTPKIAKRAKKVVEIVCRYHGWHLTAFQRSQMEHVAGEAIKATLLGSVNDLSAPSNEDDEGPGAA